MFDSGDVCSGEVFQNEPDYFKKETHFFNERKRYEQGIEFYAKRFEHCSKGNKRWWQFFQTKKKKRSYIMDATPNTLLHSKKVHNIYTQAGEDALSKLKLIVILREPISREVSLYHHKKAEYLNNPQPIEWYSDVAQNNTILTFDEYVDSYLIKSLSQQKKKKVDGIYAHQLKKWLTYFDRKQLLILSYDELNRSPERVQNLVREFLEVELSGCLKYWNAVTLLDRGTCSSSSRERSGYTVSEHANSILDPFFEKYNEELYQFLEDNQYTFPRFEKITIE